MAALFPPQNRDWALAAEANLSPHAVERICREATQKAFDEASKSLNIDWKTHFDGKQIQRRSEALGRGMVAMRDRQAPVVIAMGDGGNWIDPLLEREFRVQARIIDWYHAGERLWDCAKAIHGPQTPDTSALAEQMEAWLWDGKVDRVIAELSKQSERLGEPQATDPPQHPRRVLHQSVGYFTRHQPHMDYPTYRSNGWPIGSGETEAGVKQFNKRVKGTEQFWSEAGIEPILALRSTWLSQDERWQRYWGNRPAYVK